MFDSWCLEGNPREIKIEPGMTNKNDGHFEQIPMDLITIWLCLNMEKQFIALNLMVDHHLGMVKGSNPIILIEGSLEVKLPTLWTDGKAEVGRVSEEKRRSKKIREERKSQKKEDAGARKGRKVTNHCVLPMICGRHSKAVGAEPSGQMRDEKLHAVVARSTFRSQKC